MEYEIVQMNKKAIDDFWQLRKELFLELGEISDETDISELKLATEQYYSLHINKDLFSWGIYKEQKIVSIGSLCLFSRIPYRENLSGTEGYILNIYTAGQFRKQGFANQILDTIIEYCKQHNIERLWLSSSEQGKHLYAGKGFIKKENEMELFL